MYLGFIILFYEIIIFRISVEKETKYETYDREYEKGYKKSIRYYRNMCRHIFELVGVYAGNDKKSPYSAQEKYVEPKICKSHIFCLLISLFEYIFFFFFCKFSGSLIYLS